MNWDCPNETENLLQGTGVHGMKFKRKSVDVEAVQFFPDRKPWPKGVSEIPEWRWNPRTYRNFTFLSGGNGVISIFSGDWVVINPTGERYVVRKEKFSSTFESIR